METIFFENPAAFRKWLTKNHSSKTELWVGYHKTHTGKPSMTWLQSVEQALCFGWIDGIRKSIDAERYHIRFTPRKASSIWSAVNVKTYNKLLNAGLMKPAGKAAYEARKENNTDRYSYEQGTLELPREYLKRLKANKTTWKFFESLPPSVKKPSVWYVLSAKQEATRERRLEQLIACCAKGERLPHLTRPGTKK